MYALNLKISCYKLFREDCNVKNISELTAPYCFLYMRNVNLRSIKIIRNFHFLSMRTFFDF